MIDMAIPALHAGGDIVNCLIRHARITPHKKAFVVLTDGENGKKEVSYEELASMVAMLTTHLTDKGLQGTRVLLFYRDVLDFLVSFLACQYLDIIAVPVAYIKAEKQMEKITSIIEDAHITAVFCADAGSLQKNLPGLTKDLLVVDTRINTANAFQVLRLNEKSAYRKISFIQYTSGSTGNPKGVVITNENLLHNQQLIEHTFGCNNDSVIFTWLPFHHDMGLIGNILHTIYVGCTCIVMLPLHFIQRPQRWLQGISKYKVTHSGGPNFAYDLCVSRISPKEATALDLSNWLVAYNGSEPVLLRTLEKFAGYFRTSGFHPKSFFSCYGLAEATLLVAGNGDALSGVLFLDQQTAGDDRILLSHADNLQAEPIVSAGSVVSDMDVKIISPNTREQCDELQKGEICVAGESVTNGYWNRENNDVYYEFGGRRFLRTGDLGFFYSGQLFVYGRMKEMLIVRGKNFYPTDIEQEIYKSNCPVESNGVAVFNLYENSDEFGVVVEIKRSLIAAIDAEIIISSIEKSIVKPFGIIPFDIILTTPHAIPRTTSGKLQRFKCKDYYNGGKFKIIASKSDLQKKVMKKEQNELLLEQVFTNASYDTIKAYLLDIIACKAGDVVRTVDFDSVEFIDMGMDSLRTMEVLNIINKDLHLNLDVSVVLQHNTLSELAHVIENILWIRTKQPTGEEIII